MNRAYWLLVIPALLPLLMLTNDEGPSGKATVAKGKKTKQPKAPPDEGRVVDKAIDKWSRTERIKLHQAVEKYYPGDEGTAPHEGSDAEYNDWFDRLAGGEEVWRRAGIQKKSVRDLFARAASRLEVSGGEISREQFLRYARENLSPGKSPLWDPKPAMGPADEAVKLFRKYDRNKDAMLDQEEMPPELRGDLARWDRNSDGRISVPEYQAYFEDRVRRAAQERGVTLPGDGVAEVERRPAQAETGKWKVYRPGHMPPGLPDWFSRLDRDGDGQVGLYEWKAAGRDIEEYLRLDHNRDGFITPEECLRAARVNGPSRR